MKVILHSRKKIEIDSEFGPAGRIAWSDHVELYAQIRYEKFERFMPVDNGNDPMNDGHIVFGADDWHKYGGVAGDELELEGCSRLIVIESRPAAHYLRKHYHAAVHLAVRNLHP